MKLEKLERVVLAVKNLDDAENFFSDLFGIKFFRTTDKIARGEIKITRKFTEHAVSSLKDFQRRPTFSAEGIELLETIPPVEKEGIRSLCFKVSNLEEGKAEMKKKGFRLVEEVEIGGVKEAIYHPDDFHGIRIILNEFDAPDIVQAMQRRK
jgi:catechol 2,3-dioxygenase-like lactoylglutathione lyase family enzyme